MKYKDQLLIRIEHLKEWAKARKHHETYHRLDVNMHKKHIITTWNQVIKKLDELFPANEVWEEGNDRHSMSDL